MLEIVAPLPRVCLSHDTNVPFTQDSQYSGGLASTHRTGMPPRPAPLSVMTLPIWTSPWTSLNHQQHPGMTVPRLACTQTRYQCVWRGGSLFAGKTLTIWPPYSLLLGPAQSQLDIATLFGSSRLIQNKWPLNKSKKSRAWGQVSLGP